MNNNILVLTSKSELEIYRQLIASYEWQGADIQFTTDPAEAEALASTAQIFFGSPDRIVPLLSQAAKLAWVQSTWAGVEPFVKPNGRNDYILTNVRGIFGRLIAEYALTYILAHERHLLAHAASQQQKMWQPVMTRQLKNKTVGIVGVGSIGSDVAELMKSLGLTVWGFTRTSKGCANVDRYFHSNISGDILEFAAGVDYLINTMPHTPISENMLGHAVFQAMRPTAMLINAGRGSAIVDNDLIEALETDEFAGAVLDVFRQEPLPTDHRFWTTKNLAITPHTAAPSLPQDVVPIFHANYLRFIVNEQLHFVVDFENGY
ncbi:MAG: phosphoglycerate dehydrogenase-like enzyme [Cellvibrionaceae bacterium]|jgi:phosphoglycerate dehydrogenase-like enzyme